jgi:hypothetical protein
MPNKIEDFMAWRAYHYFFRALEGIRVANGYNTDPLVTMDYNTYRNSTTDFAVLIEAEDHGAFDHGVGGAGGPRVYQSLELIAIGNAKVKGGLPRKQAFKLEQDVRTAIHSAVAGMKETIGKGAMFEFGACPHDAGILTPENEAGFRLSFRVGYPQGKTW